MAKDLGGQDNNTDAGSLAQIVDRSRRLDLGGDFVLPPGDPITHFGAGFAKVMASNVFLSGLDLDFASHHVGYFTAPREHRHHVVVVEQDTANKKIEVRLDNGVVRTAGIYGSQGAICLPLDDSGKSVDAPFFKPQTFNAAPHLQQQCQWAPEQLVDNGELQQVIDLAFADDAMTAAVVITHHGELVAEGYRPGISPQTPLESWSMGKSLTATLLGQLIHQGVYDLWQPAPIPEWQQPGDPRAEIRIADILRMSSGLRFRAMQDPEYDQSLGYPDHLYVYTGGIDAFKYAASRGQQWAPNTIGRYRNGDPVLANYLIKLAVDQLGLNYLEYPQRSLFDPLGITSMVLECDPYGNFLTQGYEFASARDWARLANLYLSDGVWNGQRLLPEGWTDFVSTLAPAWLADDRPIYGGFFWVNGDGAWPLPKSTYLMAGAGEQRTFVIPSHDLAVVRIGHYSGAEPGKAALHRALGRLMEIIPAA